MAVLDFRRILLTILEVVVEVLLELEVQQQVLRVALVAMEQHHQLAARP